MPTIRTAAGKGAKLTPTEADANMKRTSTVKTSNYTLDNTHNREIHELGGSVTQVTLPDVSATAPEVGDWRITLINTLSASVTVARNGLTIDGMSSDLILPGKQRVTLVMNDAESGFYVVGSRLLSSLRATLSSNTAHSNSGGYQEVIFNSETYDHASANNTSTGLVTVPSGSAYFKVNAIVFFDTNATGVRVVALSTSTSSVDIFEQGQHVPATGASNATTPMINTGWIPVSVASSFYVIAYQNSGGNLNMTTNSRLYVEFK